MKHSSLGGHCSVIIFVDDCTRFKVVKFVKKSDTTAALLSLIAGYQVYNTAEAVGQMRTDR